MSIKILLGRWLIVAVVAANMTVSNAATSADVQVSGGFPSGAPGQVIVATYNVSNSGPGDATGTTFSVKFPPPLSCLWTCVALVGSCSTQSGAGDINEVLALPTGASLRYSPQCTTPSSWAGGNLSITASASPPVGVSDPNPGNNSTTSYPGFVPYATFLTMSVSDGVSAVAPGSSVTYTITAGNPVGPSDLDVSVTTSFPAAETCTWTCAAPQGGTCKPSGSGIINDFGRLPVGKSLAYTASCAISLAATGTLSTSAGVTDAKGMTYSANDVDAVLPLSDLGIAVVHGSNVAVPGTSVAYTITASNAGPGDAPGSSVVDAFPLGLSCSWICSGFGGATCSAGGNGNIADTVSLPAGGSAIYKTNCSIPPGMSGTLTDTASVATGSASADVYLANNSATDSAALVPQSDVAVTLFSDSRTYVRLNDVLNYVILVSNAIGPSDASVTVQDALPPWLSGGAWTCVAAPNVTCSSGVGQALNATVLLPFGSFVEYVYSASVTGADADDRITNAVTVSVFGGNDPVPANNSASDTDTLVIFRNGFETLVNGSDPGVASGDFVAQ